MVHLYSMCNTFPGIQLAKRCYSCYLRHKKFAKVKKEEVCFHFFLKLLYDAGGIKEESVAKSNQNFLLEGALDFSLHWRLCSPNKLQKK